MAKEIAKFKVITYDVWGNPKDGWEVNNAFNTGDVIEVTIPEETKFSGLLTKEQTEAMSKAYERLEKNLFRKLREAGWLKSGIRRKSVGIEGEYGYTLYFTDERKPSFNRMYGHSRPEFELQRIRED